MATTTRTARTARTAATVDANKAASDKIRKAVAAYVNSLIDLQKNLASIYRAFAAALQDGLPQQTAISVLMDAWTGGGQSEKTLANKASTFNAIGRLHAAGANVPAILSAAGSENAVRQAVQKACKDYKCEDARGAKKAADTVTQSQVDAAQAKASKAKEAAAKAADKVAKAKEAAKSGGMAEKLKVQLAEHEAKEKADKAKELAATAEAAKAKLAATHKVSDDEVDAPALQNAVSALVALAAEIGSDPADTGLLAAWAAATEALGKYDALLAKGLAAALKKGK